MSLDLGKAVLQLDRGALDLQCTRTARQDRLTALIEQARLVDPPTARGKTAAAASRPYLAAQVEEDLLGSVPPPHPPDNWRAISVDGSHIDVDPHLPISGATWSTWAGASSPTVPIRTRCSSTSRTRPRTGPSST